MAKKFDEIEFGRAQMQPIILRVTPYVSAVHSGLYFIQNAVLTMNSDMKNIKNTLLLTGLVATLGLSQGCALLLVGGLAAGAVYGTVSYAKNTLQVRDNVTLDRAWLAANGALKDLGIPVTSSKKDGTSGRLEGKNVKNQPVIIALTRQTDSVTEIEITVGTFDSKENRADAQYAYDRMKARY